MPDENDTKNAREATAEELLLVDLLYGELDEGEVESARTQLAEGSSSELESFQGLRALMRELPDEDPPPAISAQLLHAAAEAAPAQPSGRTAAAAAAAGGGFLSRLLDFFRPLTQSPALAAATMFVLVAGVAGALYVTGNFETTEQTIASEQAAPASDNTADTTAATPPAAEPSAAAAQGDLGRTATLATDEEAADLGITEDPAPEAEKAAETKKPASPADYRGGGKIAPRSKNRKRSKRDAPGDGVFETGSGFDSSAPPPPPKRKPAKSTSSRSTRSSRDKSGGGGVTGSAGDSPLVDLDDAEPEPAPAQESVQAPKKDDAQSRRIQVADLHQRATQAARDGECDAVRSLGARIQKLDATYYKKTYRRDKRLAACFAPATKQQKSKK